MPFLKHGLMEEHVNELIPCIIKALLVLGSYLENNLINQTNKQTKPRVLVAHDQVLPHFVPLRTSPLSQTRPTVCTTGGFDASYSNTTSVMFRVRSVLFRNARMSPVICWVVWFRSTTETLLGSGTFVANLRVRGTLEDCSLSTMSLLRRIMLRASHSTWTFSMALFSFPLPPPIVPRCWVIRSMKFLAIRACISSVHCSAR